jgi:hypothetical protein
MTMDSAELHFKQLDDARAREDFLEKEMLDSDVHHLEVRGTFFDKVAVLAAGSLAVGISFLASGMEHVEVRGEIRGRMLWVSIAFLLLFISLVLSIVHNYMVSRAVHFLSFQLQRLYKGANLIRVWVRDHPNAGVSTFALAQGGDGKRKELIKFDEEAEAYELRRGRIVWISHRVGLGAMAALIAGYVFGLAVVLRIYSSIPESPPSGSSGSTISPKSGQAQPPETTDVHSGTPAAKKAAVSH